ncbi:MAG TPA: sugar ABC transporter permease [Armatimonadota bacterium]|jgi:multiple sugar transport system permease protein
MAAGSVTAGRKAAASPRPGSLARKEAMWGYLFAAAPLLGFLIFGLIPIVMSLLLAFAKWDMFRDPRWAGFTNFARVSHDPIVLQSFVNTLVFFIGVPIGMALSLLLALALNRKIRGINWYRAIYYLPSVSSIVAVSLLWQWIFNPEKGLLNMYLLKVGIAGPEWLQNPLWVKPALILMGIWGGLGPNMILFLAGLQGVPQSLYEAASIDGATARQQFWHVTWPMLTPTTFFISIMGAIGAMQYFGQIYIMTQGGPEHASTSYMFYLWQQAFTYYRMGYASALAWVLGVIIILITVCQFQLAKRWVYYESN